MHQYIETVRNQIEAGAGQESYLTSVLFLRMYKDFQYEDDGAHKIVDKEGFERIQHKAVNSVSMGRDFDIKDEILAWQAAVLRDVTKDFYNWWVGYKEEKFRSVDCFSDGESCLAIEAACEKLDANPTDQYAALLEVEFVLNKLCTSCNKTLLELDKFWQFKYNNLKKAPDNLFMQKRIENESSHTFMYAAIATVKEVADLFASNAARLAGADHLLWMTPQLMLESLLNIMNGYLEFEYIEDSDLELMQWLDRLFPQRLDGHQPNPLYQSSLHHQVIANLSQATQCLVQHTLKKNDPFVGRDEILKSFIVDALESVKQTELTNLKPLQHAQFRKSVND